MNNRWLEFFFGSPRRALITVGIVLFLLLTATGTLAPLVDWLGFQIGIAASVLFSRIVGPLLLIGLIVFVFRYLISGGRRH